MLRNWLKRVVSRRIKRYIEFIIKKKKILIIY
jgi:hypothetical protein